jgi:LytS/YehU family sensor histidine kinase
MDSNCTVTPKPKSVKEFFKSRYFWKPFLSITIGGIGGFLYYYFVGCTSGSCAITSSPYGSILMGSFLGFFLTSSPCTRCR